MSAVSPSQPNKVASEEPEDFSLVLGGPLFQIFRRSYLSGGTLELARRRIIIIVAVTWLPLLLLTAWEGRALSRTVTVPFLLDVDVHARLLLSLPLLIIAELVVHDRLRNVARQFLLRELIPDSARAEFDRALESGKRLRNSVLAELILIGIVYGIGVLFVWRNASALDVTSWYGVTSSGELNPSLAGWWFGLVSLPVFQFLLLRWYYRLFIWARFLWKVSRIRLNLYPTHPDRAAGLGFLAQTSYAFAPLLFAQGALLAGNIANRIFYTGGNLAQFKTEIVGLIALLVLFLLAPLLAFVPQMERVKRAARREFGTLAQRYVREFDRKWLSGGSPANQDLLGNRDIQSLADLSDSYRVISEMRVVPFNLRTMLHLGVTTLAPVLPLTLTMVPLDELVNRLLKVVF